MLRWTGKEQGKQRGHLQTIVTPRTHDIRVEVEDHVDGTQDNPGDAQHAHPVETEQRVHRSFRHDALGAPPEGES